MHEPLVSIGMPSFNAAPFIAKSIESILNQKYGNFELIISDNSSSDGSYEIIKSFAKKDSRIKSSRNKTNIGAKRNFMRLLNAARGEYFMFAADHDLWADTFVEKCVQFLESNQDYVLCFGLTKHIDRDGAPKDTGDPGRAGPFPESVIARFLDVVKWHTHCYNLFYGLYRTNELRKSMPPPQDVPFGDVAVLSRIAWSGNFMVLPEPLYCRRENRPHESPYYFYKHCIDSIGLRSRFPLAYASLLKEWLRIIACAPLSFTEKMQTALDVIKASTSKGWLQFVEVDVSTVLHALTGQLMNQDSIYNSIVSIRKILRRSLR